MSDSSLKPLDPARYRSDFPILQRQLRDDVSLVYLDNAASTQRPAAVLEAMDACYRTYYANVHRGIHTLSEESTQQYEDARLAVCKFVNAASEKEVVFTGGTTAAINLVARSWGDANVRQGDVILTTIMEHHANIVPWQQLAERTGCRVEFIDINETGEISDDSIREALARHQPKLFAFTAASNVLGTINPVKSWVQMAHDAGAVTLVDAAQTAPHQQLDLQDWNSDFAVFSGHKICGPTGIGVLHGKETLLDSMPPFLGGGAMIHRVTTKGFEPAALPEKFEAGTPAIAEAIGLAAAIDYVSTVGMKAIAEHESSLCELAHQLLAPVPGMRFLGPDPEKKVGLVTFDVQGAHPHDISHWLNRRGVAIRAGHHCAMPLHERVGLNASSRASFYFYNTEADVHQLADAVAEAQQKFVRPRRKSR